MEKIRTSDIYYAAYLMSNGNKLMGISVGGSNGRKVFFEFTGENLEKQAFEYISGEATVNLRYLKTSIKHLRDIIFEKKNEKTLV